MATRRPTARRCQSRHANVDFITQGCIDELRAPELGRFELHGLELSWAELSRLVVVHRDVGVVVRCRSASPVISKVSIDATLMASKSLDSTSSKPIRLIANLLSDLGYLEMGNGAVEPDRREARRHGVSFHHSVENNVGLSGLGRLIDDR